MTFKEKLQREHPECVDEDFFGGCDKCPGDYHYEESKACNSTNEEKCRKCWDRVIPGTEDKEMTRDNLKDGMICERRDGKRYVWMNGKLNLIFVYYSEETGADLKSEDGNKEHDIVRVFVNDMSDAGNHKLIWERKEPKEMTLEDIERELGYPVKIVSAEEV